MRKNGNGKNGKQEGGKIGQERWLLTYADMITLLLALFIVLYSMSKIDAGKFHDVTQALSDQLVSGKAIFHKSLGSDIFGKKVMDFGQLRLLQQKMMERIKLAGMNANAPNGISTVIDQRGLVIHIKESALFDPGSDQLKPEAYAALDFVAEQLKDVHNAIRIEGHTDDVPINTPRFPSNWELSVGRATTVVRYLIKNHGIPPGQLSALGFGEFKPMADNSTSEGRAQNRRVDIVVLAQSELIKEPPSFENNLANAGDSIDQ